MTDLNAKIIPLRTETASLAPTAVQLDVGEIATNLEDGLIYSKKTDGTVVTLGGGGGGGGGDLDGLTDVDVSTVAPADGQSLIWDDSNSEWIPGYPSFGTATAPFTITTGDTATFPLHGSSGFYADQAALEADGFTFITGSINADDTTLQFTPSSTFQSIQFLSGEVPDSPSHSWRINSNGAVYYDNTSGTSITDRSGNAVDDGTADLYVAWWSEDTEIRIAGFLEFNDGTRDWLVVRADMKTPYNNESAGFPVETWFASDGSISVRYGAAVDSATFTAGTNRNLIVSNSTTLSSLGNHETQFEGLTGAGDYVINVVAVPQTALGRGIGDLVDVDTVTTAPTNSKSLVWDSTAERWVPGVPGTRIQEASDFELNQTPPAGLYEFTSCADAPYRIPSADYEWGVYNGELRIWQKAADGIDLRSVFDTLPGTGSVWWSNDGISFTEATYTSLVINNDGAANEYLRLQSVTPLPTTLSGSLFVKFTQPGAPIDVPLADGDILQWDDDSNTFRPGQQSLLDLWDVAITTAEEGEILIALDNGALQPPLWVAGPKICDVEYGEVTTYKYPIGLHTDVDLVTTAQEDGQVLAWNNTAELWQPADIVLSGTGRRSITHTTETLAQNASEDITLTNAGRSGLIMQLETDDAVWVVFYVSTAARTADSSRLKTEDPEPGSGIVAEFITTGNEIVLATPPAAYFNGESTPLAEIYGRITNLVNEGTRTITISVSRTEP